MYLQRRRRKWFAFHDLPADAQEKLGKRRFTQSLDTEDHDVAKRRAALLEARWRGEIERVRRFSPDAVEREAEFWNRLLREAPDDNERDLIKDAIADAARERVEKAAVKAGIIDCTKVDANCAARRRSTARKVIYARHITSTGSRGTVPTILEIWCWSVRTTMQRSTRLTRRSTGAG